MSYNTLRGEAGNSSCSAPQVRTTLLNTMYVALRCAAPAMIYHPCRHWLVGISISNPALPTITVSRQARLLYCSTRNSRGRKRRP